MSDNARLTTHKIFLLPDYEKEGEYLTKMHNVGWKLEKVCAFSQHFVKCEPENVIYKLDYVANKTDYVVSTEPVACTRLESSDMYIWSLSKSIS